MLVHGTGRRIIEVGMNMADGAFRILRTARRGEDKIDFYGGRSVFGDEPPPDHLVITGRLGGNQGCALGRFQRKEIVGRRRAANRRLEPPVQHPPHFRQPDCPEMEWRIGGSTGLGMAWSYVFPDRLREYSLGEFTENSVAWAQASLKKTTAITERLRRWRRERDSNPRYGFPYTHFPGVRLQPLGHPSIVELELRVQQSSKTWLDFRPRDAEDGPVSLIPPQWQGRKAGCP